MRWWKLGLVGCLSLAVLLVGLAIGWFQKEEWHTETSPDGRYTLTVYRYCHQLPVCMPGGGSDAPGVIVLRDTHGWVVERARVDMLTQVGRVEWAEDRVSMKLVFDWALP